MGATVGACGVGAGVESRFAYQTAPAIPRPTANAPPANHTHHGVARSGGIGVTCALYPPYRCDPMCGEIDASDCGVGTVVAMPGGSGSMCGGSCVVGAGRVPLCWTGA